MSYKIGVSTNLLHDSENILSSIELLSNVSSIIEIEFENKAKSILAYSPKKLENWLCAMETLKAQKDLSYSVHAPYIGHTADIASNFKDVRLLAVDCMLQCMDVAHQLGAKLFTFHPGYLPQVNECYDYFLNLRRSLNIMAKRANELNICLSIENTGAERSKYIVLSEKEYILLQQEFNIKMTMDVVHYTSFNASIDRSYFDGLLAYLPYIANVHFADMRGSDHRHLPLGEGDFPYKKVIQFLYDNGYTGNAVIEETGGAFSAEYYLKKASEYIHETKCS